MFSAHSCELAPSWSPAVGHKWQYLLATGMPFPGSLEGLQVIVEKGQGKGRSRGVLLIPAMVLGGAEADGSQGDNSLSCGALWWFWAALRAGADGVCERWGRPQQRLGWILLLKWLCSVQTQGRCWWSAGHSAHLTYGEIGKSPFSLWLLPGLCHPWQQRNVHV